MKMSMLIAVPLFFLLACQAEQTESAAEVSGEPTAIIPEYPVWVNASCDSRTLRLMTANIPPDSLTIRLDGTTVEAEPAPSSQGESGNAMYWEIDIPSDEGYENLSVARQTEEGEVPMAASSILYVLPEEEVQLFSYYTTLTPPARSESPNCWPNYDGPVIPGGQSYTLSYDRTQLDRVFVSDMRRTIRLSNVQLTGEQSGEAYRVAPPLEHTKTIPDAIALLGRVEGLAGIDLGDKGRKETASKVANLSVESQADATPSYQVVMREYGSDILLRIKDCNTVDTLSQAPFIVPERLQVELNCQP